MFEGLAASQAALAEVKEWAGPRIFGQNYRIMKFCRSIPREELARMVEGMEVADLRDYLEREASQSALMRIYYAAHDANSLARGNDLQLLDDLAYAQKSSTRIHAMALAAALRAVQRCREEEKRHYNNLR